MQKILFFETPEFTGASRVTHTIAKTLRNQYIEVFAKVAPDENAQSNVSLAIDANFPDIVFCSFIVLNPYVIIEGKKRKLRVVIRNDYWLKDVAPDVRQRAKETYYLSDQIIVQTEPLRQELLTEFALDSHKVIVKENPIDKEGIQEALKETGSPYPDNSCRHFVWVGRFDPIKNLPFLLESFRFVHEKDSKTELYLVGEPDDKRKYKQDGVFLVGFQKNPYPWIKFADCLVLCSRSEASPNIINEAYYLGCTIVTTNCFDWGGDLRDFYIVKDYETQLFAKKLLNIIK